MREETIRSWSKHFKQIRKGSAFAFTDLKRTGLNALACQKLINLGVSTGSIKKLGKEGRFTMYKKLNHLSQLPKKKVTMLKDETENVKSFNQDKMKKEAIIVVEKDMVIMPASHYNKLTQTVAEITRELVALKKEKERHEQLDVILAQYLSKKS